MKKQALLDTSFVGAAHDRIEVIDQTQRQLNIIKHNKMETRRGQWRNSNSSMIFLLKHLAEEVTELNVAIATDDLQKAIEEASDVSNMVDIITVLLFETRDSRWPKIKRSASKRTCSNCGALIPLVSSTCPKCGVSKP